MKKYYRLPAPADNPFKGKDRFIKDKHKRYLRLDTDTTGSMGYWDKTLVPMYTLSMQLQDTLLTCTLIRQEEKKGKLHHPHDMLFSGLVSLGVLALLYLILGVLVRLSTSLALFISVFAAVVVLIAMVIVYRLEYRGFYRLMDTFMQKTLRASPCRK